MSGANRSLGDQAPTSGSSRSEERLLAMAGWGGTVFGWLCFPAGALAVFALVMVLPSSGGTLPLAVVGGVAAAPAVRVGTCGQWIRERDVSAWPDIRDAAKQAMVGSALVGAIALALLSWAKLEGSRLLVTTIAAFAVPGVVEGALLGRSAEVMQRRQRGERTP